MPSLKYILKGNQLKALPRPTKNLQKYGQTLRLNKACMQAADL